MKGTFTRFAKVLPVLVVAGCGVSTTMGGNTALPAAGKSVANPPAGAVSAKTADKGGVRTSEITLKSAYARLTASPSFVPRGGMSSLWLDVWSDDKQIRSYDARWYASEGNLSFWLTQNRLINTWFAPFSPIFQTDYIQARVHVDFADGTQANGTVQVNIWVQ